jgi:DNA-directed RNA polymerase specialized sigma54-like protein
MNSTDLKTLPRQDLSTHQKHVMSMRTIAALSVLQLSSVELEADLADAFAMNPFLEEIEK